MLTGFIAMCAGVTAQDKNAIILINSVPYNVVVSKDGEIKEIKGEARGHMKGYKKSADAFDIPVSDRTIDIASDVAEGSSVRNERSMVTFQDAFATLDDAALLVLNEVANSFNPVSGEKIMISSFKPSEGDSNTLFTNRIASIRTYLELKGIPISKILTEVVVSPALKDKVSITYIQ